ncbi:allantoicase, partial [Burkholderia pseudomallei]
MNIAETRNFSNSHFSSDEYLYPNEPNLHPEPALFIPDNYNNHAKSNDVSETRINPTNLHHYCV